MTFSLNSMRVPRVLAIGSHDRQVIASASGFFVEWRSRLFLATNHHVVSGLENGEIGSETADWEVLDEHGRVPGWLRLEYHSSGIPTDGGAVQPEERISEDIPLYEEPTDTLDPLWFEHPDLGRSVDVVAVPLPEEVFGGARPVACPMEKLSERFDLSVMDMVFITGYPRRNEITPNRFPIYKVGFVASEPGFAKTDRPYFLVDGSPRPGMSGSPVVFAPEAAMKQNGQQLQWISGVWQYVGIYSGRDEPAELGLVWPNDKVLLPILEHACDALDHGEEAQ